MSFDLQDPRGVEPARIALDEFRVTQDECAEFFGDVFDQLHALSLELFARHKCLEVGTEQKSESAETLVGLREALHRSIEELQRLHGQVQADREEAQASWAEIRAGYRQLLDDHADLHATRDGFRQMVSEFSGIKEELKRMWNLLETLARPGPRRTASAGRKHEGAAER